MGLHTLLHQRSRCGEVYPLRVSTLMKQVAAEESDVGSIIFLDVLIVEIGHPIECFIARQQNIRPLESPPKTLRNYRRVGKLVLEE